MVNIDTFKIIIPSEVGRVSDKDKYNFAKYRPQLVADQDEVLTSGYAFQEKHSGLNYINETQQGLKIQGSCPNLVGHNPRNLGNKTNFHLILAELAKIGSLEIDIPGAMKHGFFCLLHATKDVDFGSASVVDRAINMLSVLGDPYRYNSKQYTNRAKGIGYAGEGLKFDRDVKQNNRNTHQLKFYNKGAELSSKNPGAYQALVNAGTFGEIAGLLRLEAQCPTFHTIKQRCGCKDTRIGNVLAGKTHPVDSILRELIKNSKIASPTKKVPCYGLDLLNVNELKLPKKISMKEIKDEIFARTIIQNCGTNEKEIKAFFKRSGQTRQAIHKEMKKLRPHIQQANRDALKIEHGGSWGLSELEKFAELVKRA